MKWNVFIEYQQTVHLRQKARGHLQLLQVDLEAGQWMLVKGWLLNKKEGGDSDKRNEEGNLVADRELGDAPKPKPRVSKRQKQNDEFQKQVINLLDQEDDDIDLYFQSLAKKLKRTLTEGEIDNVMDEINGVVSRHVRQARIKKRGGGSMLPCPPGQPQYQQVQVDQQQGQHPQQDVNMPLPPMLSLQQYSDDNNMTYAQL